MRALAAAVLGLVLLACRASTPSDPDQAFWRWFADNAASLREDESLVDVMNRITVELKQSHPGVFAEIGEDHGTRRLVLTADGDRKVFPTVDRLYAARPPSIAGWTIQALRAPLDANDAMKKLAMKGREIEPSTVRYLAQREASKLNVRVYVPGWTPGDEALHGLVFLVLDHLLGERDTETRIGSISIRALDEAPAEARSLRELPADVHALSAGDQSAAGSR